MVKEMSLAVWLPACCGLSGVEERVSQGDFVDMGRQRRIDDEANRHVAPLTDAEFLRREAETLGFVKVFGGLARRDTGNGACLGGDAREVFRIKLRVVQLAGMDAHRGGLRPE